MLITIVLIGAIIAGAVWYFGVSKVKAAADEVVQDVGKAVDGVKK